MFNADLGIKNFGEKMTYIYLLKLLVAAMFPTFREVFVFHYRWKEVPNMGILSFLAPYNLLNSLKPAYSIVLKF